VTAVAEAQIRQVLTDYEYLFRQPCRVVQLAGRRLLAAVVLILVLTAAGSFALSRPAGQVYNPNQSWALWQCHVKHQPLPSCVLANEGPVMGWQDRSLAGLHFRSAPGVAVLTHRPGALK
jgi:hypothetical protein